MNDAHHVAHIRSMPAGRSYHENNDAAVSAEELEIMMKNYKFWFCTGSQDLYGDECLRKVAEHSAKIVEGMNAGGKSSFVDYFKADPDQPGIHPQDL